MSYTPTNWSTGNTITASALNKIEQGIASGSSDIKVVKVVSEAEGSLWAYYGYIKQGVDPQYPTQWALTIDVTDTSNVINLAGSYIKRVVGVPIDPTNELTAGIYISYYAYTIFDIETSGGVSSEPIVVHGRSGTGWSSAEYYFYVVTGNGTITFSPKVA